MKAPSQPSNLWVQATPDYALLFIVAQVSGAPDPARYLLAENIASL